jgi:hypothetical protein
MKDFPVMTKIEEAGQKVTEYDRESALKWVRLFAEDSEVRVWIESPNTMNFLF